MTISIDLIDNLALPRGFHFGLDLPRAGTEEAGHLLSMSGWCFHESGDPVALKIQVDNVSLNPPSVGHARPDVPNAFPSLGARIDCGWGGLLSLVGLPQRFSLVVAAARPDAPWAPMCRIEGRRTPISSTVVDPRPLVVTTIGRSGSSILMHLLDQLPEVVTYPTWPYELQASRAWMQDLCALAEHPQGPRAPTIFSAAPEPDRWLAAINPWTDPVMRAWWSKDQVERTGAWAAESVSDFYVHLATSRGEPRPRFYAEKHGPLPWGPMLLELSRDSFDVVLVRDPRDTLCSMLDFTTSRRGGRGFGREHRESDAEFVREVLAVNTSMLLQAAKRPGAHVVRYEDLMLHPRHVVEHLLDHLQLDRRPDDVGDALARWTTDTSEMAEHRTTESPRASIGRWRQELPEHLLESCFEVMPDALEAFGYDAR